MPQISSAECSSYLNVRAIFSTANKSSEFDASFMSLLSPIVGGTAGKEFTYTCPNGSYITQFDGKSGGVIDGFSVKCSDGSSSPRFGGLGGAAWGEFSPTGFTGANMRGSPTYFTNMQLKTDAGPLTAHGGTAGTQYVWTCPSGKIASVNGLADQYVNRVQFGCATSATPSASGASWWLLFLVLIFAVVIAAIYMSRGVKGFFGGDENYRNDY